MSHAIISGMTSEELPAAAEAEHLTEALRRCGALANGRVSGVAVESSRNTILSRIIRLRLSYEGTAADAPRSIIVKTGLPERAESNSGRREVAFYTQVAAVMSARLVPRCLDAHWDADTNLWHIVLEDLWDSHFIFAAVEDLACRELIAGHHGDF
jgi:hypothetical protein